MCMYVWQAAALGKGIHQRENASHLVASAKGLPGLTHPVLPALKTRM